MNLSNDPVVRLLFDQMLPRFTARALNLPHETTAHVRDWGMEEEDDAVIREKTGREGFTIVTKDDDFQALLARFGAPPRVVWLRFESATRARTLRTLQADMEKIYAFHVTDGKCFIIDRVAGPTDV